MATQTIRLNLGRLSGTFVADVYLDGTDTTFATDAAMSAASQPGWYTFTLSGSAGVCSVIVKESSARIGSWWIKTTDTAATFLAADTRDEVVAAAERALLSTASGQVALQTSVDDLPTNGELTTALSGLATSAEIDAVPTAAEIAAALLITPANKLATNASGYVTSTNGGGGGASEVESFTDAALDQLRGVEFIGPEQVYGTAKQIVAGDDYSGTRAIVFASEAFPDLTTATTITLTVRATSKDHPIAFSTTSVVFSEVPRKLTATLTATDTRQAAGWYTYDIEAVVDGKKQTVVGPGARLVILEDQTR